MPLKLPKLDSTMALVTVTIRMRDPKTGQMIEVTGEGIPSPEMQRFWQAAVIKSDGAGDTVLDKVTKLNTGVWPGGTAPASYSQSWGQSVSDTLGLISSALQN